MISARNALKWVAFAILLPIFLAAEITMVGIGIWMFWSFIKIITGNG